MPNTPTTKSATPMVPRSNLRWVTHIEFRVTNPTISATKLYLHITDRFSFLSLINTGHQLNKTYYTCHSPNSQCHPILINLHLDTWDHEMVDHAAKESTLHPKITDPLPSPSYDFKHNYRSLNLTASHNLWTNQLTNKLRLIKNKCTPWSSRHAEVIFSRLRTGHIRLTHSYLPLNLQRPFCDYCQADNLTI